MEQLWVTVIQTSLMERPFTPTEQDCPRGITRRNEGAGAAVPLRVDAHKPANSFDPDKSLGSSMDELSIGVIQKIYTPEMVRQWLAAGWGPITYRNYTELAIVAWHWNGEPTSRFHDQGGPRRQSEGAQMFCQRAARQSSRLGLVRFLCRPGSIECSEREFPKGSRTCPPLNPSNSPTFMPKR